ncbi:MAG: glycyl radical protein [Candidatus Aminicenantes bacterium]|nr:glycyl radical protein [Candidatus Aminicenantes bacterium]
MNERIRKLREQSLKTRTSLDPERALLMTEFYEDCRSTTLSAPMKRALAFQHFCERKTVYIGDGELIVGERGPAPKATPTFPEITVHSLQDLDILNSREKVSFKVSPETRRLYKERIIPFWKGRTIREKIMEEMTPEWKDAYDAGVFTEFMEQRAPGHTVLDDKIYGRGFLAFKAEIAAALAGLDFERDPDALSKREELRAMDVAADALIRLAERHAEKARALALKAKDPRRKKELLRIADVCARVPARAPRDFWEALQSYWFVHLGVISELNTWDSFNPGKLDQHLAPFYRDGLASGRLTEDAARELLQAFWIKFNNQPAPPKVGVTAEESATYTDFCQINLGGLTPEGNDAVSDMTYLLLDVIEEMRLLQPSSSVQISRRNPDRFVRRAIEILKTGFGQPSFFNADLIVEELLRQGKTLEDARRGGSSGCVEVGVFGRENYNLTGYFNLPKILEITLNDGVDPRTGKAIGLRTGDPASFASFDVLLDAYARQVRRFVDIKIRGNAVIERIYAEYMPTPYLSLLIDDCIARGRDYHDGGARYNTSYIQGVGLGTISDALTALRYHVFDKKTVAFKDVLRALGRNFKGAETLRQRLLHKTPKYGNDDDYADDSMKRVFELYYDAVNGRPNTKGGVYRINLLPTTVHVYFGMVSGATPDGRKAGEPLSEGVSPVQGADRQGPTAVLSSVAKMDHVRTGGTLLNQKFTPQLLSDGRGVDGLLALVRSYFKLDGHHIQFNVVSADILRDAQRHPDQYRDLIVRVAGYSDYFIDLGRTLQDEIIRRTEHVSV